jgi:hypothetical protein
MSALNDALHQVGVDLGSNDASSNLSGAISDFSAQNLTVNTISNLANLRTGGAAMPAAGEWESIHYADDLNNHHPKFKFLFKVNFIGFPGGSDFSYFVHRCDKPKVRFNHTDVNFYNFRSKVLTSTSFDPLTFTFLDEIGNSVNSFFASYLAARSQQGNGKASIQGGAEYSSTIPYANGYSAGAKVEIQQIFGNGVATNIFTLINARVDALEFDELSMELSAGSMMTCTVSYDAISCRTTSHNKVNSWGQTDLYGALPTDQNAGSHDTEIAVPSSAVGGGIAGDTPFVTNTAQEDFNKFEHNQAAQDLPPSIVDLGPVHYEIMSRITIPPETSNEDVVSTNIQETITAINTGENLCSGGTGVREGRNCNITDDSRSNAQKWLAKQKLN